MQVLRRRDRLGGRDRAGTCAGRPWLPGQDDARRRLPGRRQPPDRDGRRHRDVYDRRGGLKLADGGLIARSTLPSGPRDVFYADAERVIAEG
jgi:hypothetical protein